MSKQLDVRGLSCPLPVIEARKVLKSMTTGSLEVLVDNEIAIKNLEKMAGQMGLKYGLEQSVPEEYRIRIFLKEVGEDPSEKSQSEKIQAGKVVVITSEFMGGGDPTLGKILLKGFIYTLTELEQYPEKVLLYNSGVKLAIGGSDSLTDLKKLEDNGVEILSCGTCLDFYQITGDLSVGSVTNMYEIAQSMMGANEIIQP